MECCSEYFLLYLEFSENVVKIRLCLRWTALCIMRMSEEDCCIQAVGGFFVTFLVEKCRLHIHMQKANEGLTMILMHKSTQQFGCIFFKL